MTHDKQDTPPTLVWFRQDLRLDDNPALIEAAARGPVVPVFILPPDDEDGAWPPGGASRVWLHHSLAALDAALCGHGARLVLRRGPSLETLLALCDETGARAVCWNRRYEPAVIARDTSIKEALRARGVAVDTFNGALLFEPWHIKTAGGTPFQVFTPFWRACMNAPRPPEPRAAPKRLAPPGRWPRSLPLDDFALSPSIDWAAGIRAAWTPGESGARQALARFLKNPIEHYADQRDQPAVIGTSRLSAHLHWGELGARQVFWAVREHAARAGTNADKYQAEIGWREFAHHLLFHCPRTPIEPLRPTFAAFPWARSPAHLRAWQRGRTGYPLVDAGMRELWTTGWMHNRVRMVVASFLVKHLLLRWQDGARWFWDTLVDADLANNTLGWQWSAGSGADAAPYFRVFNPITQSRKFDPDARYVRRWVPELAKLPAEHAHAPWEAPPEVLARAGVVLGTTYPGPIVDHAWARTRALAAFATLKSQGKTSAPRTR